MTDCLRIVYPGLDVDNLYDPSVGHPTLRSATLSVNSMNVTPGANIRLTRSTMN